jgi:hypothetical protein
VTAPGSGAGRIVALLAALGLLAGATGAHLARSRAQLAGLAGSPAPTSAAGPPRPAAVATVRATATVPAILWSGPDRRPVLDGQLLEGAARTPLRVDVGDAGGSLVVQGRFRVISTRRALPSQPSRTPDPGPGVDLELDGVLSSGNLRAAMPRGRARVHVENTGTTVVVSRGTVHVEVKGPIVLVAAHSGEVTVAPGRDPDLTLRAGQAGRFRAGRLVRPIEDLGEPPGD